MLSEAKVTEIYDMAADFCRKNDIKLTLFAILAYTAESLQGALRSGDTLPSNLPKPPNIPQNKVNAASLHPEEGLI